jgi:hypothetical protein
LKIGAVQTTVKEMLVAAVAMAVVAAVAVAAVVIDGKIFQQNSINFQKSFIRNRNDKKNFLLCYVLFFFFFDFF